MMVLGATVTPIPGLRIQGLFNWYDNNYSDWSPASREISGGTADREQVWIVIVIPVEQSLNSQYLYWYLKK
jgi:hypothetical protein